jgi:hypothetical protein
VLYQLSYDHHFLDMVCSAQLMLAECSITITIPRNLNLCSDTTGFVRTEGVEPPTHSLEGCCSIQLSYVR